MSLLCQLKKFCTVNGLEFPKFSQCYRNNNSIAYQVDWYSEHVFTSASFATDDEALKSCVYFLSDWVSNEKNFLTLLGYEASARMVIV